jgi:hypothetical protein
MRLSPAHQDESPDPLRRERQVAGKLDGITGALFGMDEQSLSGDGMTIPLGMRTNEGRELAGPPPSAFMGARR